MSDIDGISWSESGESVGIVETSGARGVVVGLGLKTRSISTRVCQISRRAVHRVTAKRRAKARGIGDGDGAPVGGIQDSTGVVEGFEGPATGVDNGSDDLQILQSIDVGSRDPNGQVEDSGDRGHGRDDGDIGDEGEKGNTKGRGQH